MMSDEMDAKAPHGRDDHGVPLAPFGYKANGDPKKDRRGRAAGTRVADGPRRKPAGSKSAPKRSDQQTREMLVSLSDMVTMPLAGAARSPVVRKRLGENQAMALSGDAVILQSYAPHLADGLLALSQTKPGVLNFLDTMEGKAPYLMLAQVGMQMAKAMVSNHIHPDARLAAAGQTMAQIRTAQMAEQIEREARAMGIDPTQVVQDEPEYEAA